MGSLDSRSEHTPSSQPDNSLMAIPKPRVVRRIVSCPPGTRKATSSDPGRKVSFKAEVESFDVVRRCDMSEEEISTIWYCKLDFKEMKREYIPTLKKMAKNLPLDSSDVDPRGLEHKTPQGTKKRHRNRLTSLDAVLVEQDRQWERNRRDPDFIAEMYIQASAHCSIQATLIAQADADYVEQNVRNAVLEEVNDNLHGLPTIDEASVIKSPVTPSRRTKTYTVSNGFRSPRVLSAAA
eukprot:Nitzschia sp. Nitz4//scaffold56_size114212//112689//113399//NITZ4_003976-RA/size114212-processed-gene-0.79-mRNA-1//-1//CDS//3329554784//9095//frame0